MSARKSNTSTPRIVTQPAADAALETFMYRTRKSLPARIRAGSVALLNQHLAAAIDLQAQVKQAHWTVRGPGFIAIHELFDRTVTAVAEYADLIAERTGAIGGAAEGTVQTAAKSSFLSPYPLRIADTQSHVNAVGEALAAFGASARDAIDRATTLGDADTADVFTEISRGIDQLLWFVESHVDPVTDTSDRDRQAAETQGSTKTTAAA
ncbi:MAG: DNA starvation/stationary phase protection protein Dps [Betaproteobacteria bacterium]